MLGCMDRWKRLAQLASVQYHLVAVWQAEGLGISRQLMASYAEERGWRRVRLGVYLVANVGFPPLAQVKAAELALHREGLASHRAAGFVLGITEHLWSPIEFLVGRDCSRRPEDTKIRSSVHVGRREVITRSSIRLTDPDWTLCTLASVCSLGHLVKALQVADRKRLATPTSVAACAGELGRFHGRGRLLRALEQLETGMTHSGLEALARRRLSEAGFHPHPHPFAVEHQGRLLAELDIAFVDEKVGIPVDGPHHFEPDQKRADDDIRHRLQLLGWLIIPVDDERLTNQPHVFLRQVREALRARGSLMAG